MKKCITDLNLEDKKVLVRVDFNVPLNDKLEITDDTRIKAALKTIKYLQEKGAITILASHLGRPKGKIVKELSLDPVAQRLAELLNSEITKVDSVVGDEPLTAISDMEKGDILLLENLRFEPGEEKNDDDFSRKLAGLADIFVNDAFGTAHRAHASTVGISKYIPSAVGFLMKKELETLNILVNNPERPFTTILGGAKIGDKIEVIKSLIKKVDNLLIGGGMAYTFFKSKGLEIGESIVEEDKLMIAKSLIEEANEKGTKLYLPEDIVIAYEFKEDASFKTVDSSHIPKKWMGMDIGEKTINEYSQVINKSKTVLWNGPMGVFEMDSFAKGTKALATKIADLDAFTVIGGGDSAAAITQMGFADKIEHISTGGGATLEFLEGRTLPGVAAIDE